MVNPKLDGLSQEQLSASASGGQDLESPIAFWFRAVEMFARENTLAELELGSKQQRPEDLLASDLNVDRARALASLI